MSLGEEIERALGGRNSSLDMNSSFVSIVVIVVTLYSITFFLYEHYLVVILGVCWSSRLRNSDVGLQPVGYTCMLFFLYVVFSFMHENHENHTYCVGAYLAHCNYVRKITSYLSAGMS